jgi:hypothetical protein
MSVSRAPEALVPDAAEPVTGWRGWMAVSRGKGEVGLSSIGYPLPWPPRKPWRASCMAARRPCPSSPGGGCGCGIHALASLDEVLRHLPHPLWPPLVVGTVSLWGRVVVGTKGWRAEYAYPRRLILLQRGRSAQSKAVALERAYDVPVLSASPGELDSVVGRELW